ncbi:L-Aspartase-like family protein [Artemisia annua]|uniref:L-Aspartase-like family protein n=1 Tax=Artemisia annua TaxID=35608 RepID=A0A2U1MDY8_ARTAN|nr:L-Aspartase-like family protein [Artemisia annua]
MKVGENGSVTLPYKLNQVDFDNSEGIFGTSSAIQDHLSMTLPISLPQKDEENRVFWNKFAGSQAERADPAV